MHDDDDDGETGSVVLCTMPNTSACLSSSSATPSFKCAHAPWTSLAPSLPHHHPVPLPPSLSNKDFLERLQPLPNDIQRSFHLMRELDKDATELHMYVLRRKSEEGEDGREGGREGED